MSHFDPLRDWIATRRRALQRFVSSCGPSLPIDPQVWRKLASHPRPFLGSATDSFHRRGREFAPASIPLLLLYHREEGAACLHEGIPPVARHRRNSCRGPRPSPCRRHTVLLG